jgi:CSLREA domain-containing protein
MSIGSKLLAVTVLLLVSAWDIAPADAGPANIFTITKTADTADGTCDSDCSVREAVIAANATSGASVINIPPGTYAISIAGQFDDVAAEGDLDITRSVNIYGDAPENTILDGGGLDRIIENFAPSLVISNVTFTNGRFGAISNHEGNTVTLMNSTVRNNEGNGWATIGSNGNLSLRNVSVHDNNTDASGGALATSGDVTIEASTFYANAAEGDGGALRLRNATATIANSTISGNFAGRNGGAISVDGSTSSVTVRDTTIADNTADSDTNGEGDGGGVFAHYGNQISLGNTILAGNNDAGGESPDCATWGDPFVSLGHNLLGSTNGCSIGNMPTDITGEDPMLFPLANNGGVTHTHLPAPGSPAIDNGDDAGCPDFDQRGFERPQGAHCDIGAVEVGLQPGQRIWGDVDCDGDITTRDNQAELRFVLEQNALSQTEPCPDIGSAVTVDGTARTWGDEDCDTGVSTRDNQSKLRFVLEQNALSQTEPCPDVGAPVSVSVAAAARAR